MIFKVILLALICGHTLPDYDYQMIAKEMTHKGGNYKGKEGDDHCRGGLGETCH
jgi:hypothetical protein